MIFKESVVVLVIYSCQKLYCLFQTVKFERNRQVSPVDILFLWLS